MRLLASCAFGLEAVLSRELKALGFEDVTSENGKVHFQSDEAGLLRANLWLRTADRVYLNLGDFEASTFEELFQGVQAIDWPALLPRNAEFPVTGHSVKSQLTSVPACQSIIKKSVVERLKKRYSLEQFPEDGPLFPIRFALVKDRCTVMLDTSGRGLHRRGYRTLNAEAPLRETLAAGLVLLSYWNKERELYDLFCGSGTILLEAALIGLDRAPGLRREFLCESWGLLPEKVAAEVREEAEQRFDRTTQLQLYGSDVDGRVLDLARQHLQQAELEERGIFFQKRPMHEFSSKRKYACLISNPPYGERQMDRSEAEKLYAELGEKLQTHDTWSCYVLTSHQEFPRFFGREPGRKRKLYNGKLQVTYFQYPGPRPPVQR